MPQITVIIGSKKFDVNVDTQNPPSKSSENEEGTSESLEKPSILKTIGDLRNFVNDNSDLDGNSAKMIYKGKYMGHEPDESLELYRFKPNDKLMVMGQPKPGMKRDQNPGMEKLLNYEKKNLVQLNKTYEELDNDLTELERNFLDGPALKEMIKRMDKRIKHFTETALKHLENIDGLQIFDESTSDEIKIKNREKRKQLIDGIQTLMNQNDKFHFRLEYYKFKIDHPDEGGPQ